MKALQLLFLHHLRSVVYSAVIMVATCLQAIRGFFRMNRGTCQEWLSRIRANLVIMAIHAGLPAAAVRHGYEALMIEHNPRSVEFWIMLVRVMQALIQLRGWEAIHGISIWCKNHIGQQSWIDAACAQAKGRCDHVIIM